MISRLSFNQSRALGFVESPAMERNIDNSRNLITVGVGNPKVFQDVRVREVYSSPQDIHTELLDQDLIVGETGAFGSVAIGGSGIARILLHVKGVACKIPPIDYDVENTKQGQKPMGALLKVAANGIRSVTRIRATRTRFHGAPPLVDQLLTQNEVCLNLFAEQAEEDQPWSSDPFVMDRIIAVSANLPTTISGVLSFFSWAGLTYGGGTYGPFWKGGTTGAEVAWANNADLATKLGVSVNASGSDSYTICDNPSGLQTRSLLPPYDLFPAIPINTVQLECQLIGWRPDTALRPEAYHDLAS